MGRGCGSNAPPRAGATTPQTASPGTVRRRSDRLHSAHRPPPRKEHRHMPFAAIRVSQGSETREVHSERLTAEEEKSMAREIRKAEQSARESIAGINSAENILMRRPDRAERTR